jgi:hypothetical protein
LNPHVLWPVGVLLSLTSARRPAVWSAIGWLLSD